MTPAEFSRHMDAWVWRRKQDVEAQQRLAFNTAALTAKAMAGKLKKFEEIFKEKTPVTGAQKKKLQGDFRKLSGFLQKEREKQYGNGPR